MSESRHDIRPERFFVAASLPDAVVDSVCCIRPEPAPGVRLTDDDQLHLTLHFLGPADEFQVTAALSNVVIGQVPITVAGVGHFVGRDGSVTLWAGVTPSPELTELHERVAVSLYPIGYKSEDRAFTPHISLARCDPTVGTEYRDEFLAAGIALVERGTIDTIELFASTFINDVPKYRPLTSFIDND